MQFAKKLKKNNLVAVRAGEEYDSDNSDDSCDSQEERDVEDYWIGVVVEEYAVAPADSMIHVRQIASGTAYIVLKWLVHDETVVLPGGARQYLYETHLPYVLDRLPSVIPVKLGTLGDKAKKAVLSDTKNTKLMAVLEPAGPLPLE